MRFKALFVDHDDTAVNSTREIHHAAHVAAMRELRPHATPCSFETWIEKNHYPGIAKFLEELCLSPAERQRELAVWRDYTSRLTPRFFDGFLDTLRRFAAQGGIVAVVSHSEEAQIRRHYREAGGGFMPHFVYGWNDTDHNRMKPAPFPVLDVLARCPGLTKKDCAVLDDLNPGITMARAAGVTALGAGWGHSIPAISASMRASCDAYFPTVAQFADYLFDTTHIATAASS